MVGRLSQSSRLDIAQKLSSTLGDLKDVLFVISSDFCHYGQRFEYHRFKDDISARIKELDLAGFQAISTNNPDTFQQYLSTTGNTICGREPLLLFLTLLSKYKSTCSWKLLSYSQSNEISSQSDRLDRLDSSVSYLSAKLIIKP